MIVRISRTIAALYRTVLRAVKMNPMLGINCIILLLNVLFCAYNKNLTLSFVKHSLVEANFLSPLDPDEIALLDRTFRVFADTLIAANITFFIFSGTLIGSVRHHGRIPWDDDIDVIINVTDKHRVIEVLSRPSLKSFGLFTGDVTDDNYTYQWKFYPKNGHGLFYKKYRSPYIDVFFFYENDTHIWNGSPYFKDTEVWPKRIVFPLRMRPFGDLEVPAPCNVDRFLGQNFNISECRSREFSHYFELPLLFDSVTVPCERLAHVYPFVHRTSINSRKPLIKEALVFQGMEIKRFLSQVPCFTVHESAIGKRFN